MFSFFKRTAKKLDNELDKTVGEMNGKRIVIWTLLVAVIFFSVSSLGDLAKKHTHEKIWAEQRAAESKALGGYNYRTYYPRETPEI